MKIVKLLGWNDTFVEFPGGGVWVRSHVFSEEEKGTDLDWNVFIPDEKYGIWVTDSELGVEYFRSFTEQELDDFFPELKNESF